MTAQIIHEPFMEEFLEALDKYIIDLRQTLEDEYEDGRQGAMKMVMMKGTMQGMLMLKRSSQNEIRRTNGIP